MDFTKTEKAAVQVQNPTPSSGGQQGSADAQLGDSHTYTQDLGSQAASSRLKSSKEKTHLWRVATQTWYLVVRVSPRGLAVFPDPPL